MELARFLIDFKIIDSDMSDGRCKLTPFTRVEKKGDIYQNSLFPQFFYLLNILILTA